MAFENVYVLKNLCVRSSSADKVNYLKDHLEYQAQIHCHARLTTSFEFHTKKCRSRSALITRDNERQMLTR